jgi:hypothetical protein
MQIIQAFKNIVHGPVTFSGDALIAAAEKLSRACADATRPELMQAET